MNCAMTPWIVAQASMFLDSERAKHARKLPLSSYFLGWLVTIVLPCQSSTRLNGLTFFLFPDEELEHWFDLNIQECSNVVKFDEIQNNTNN